MEFQAEKTHANTAVKPLWKQYRLFHAAFAQFCYTGAQVAIAGYFINVSHLNITFCAGMPALARRVTTVSLITAGTGSKRKTPVAEIWCFPAFLEL